MEYAVPARDGKKMMQAVMDLIAQKNYTVNYISAFRCCIFTST